MYGINYDGLRKRKSYEQLLFDIENQPMIKYPNRAAKFLRNSQIISNLLDGDIADLTENENRRKLLSIGLKIEKNKIREHFIGSEIDIDGYESADSVDEELVRRFEEEEERKKKFAEMMKKRLEEEEAEKIKAREIKIKLKEEKIDEIKKGEEQEKQLIFEIFKRTRVKGKTIEDNFLKFADNYLYKKARRNIANAISTIKEPKNITLDYSKFNDGRRRKAEKKKKIELIEKELLEPKETKEKELLNELFFQKLLENKENSEKQRIIFQKLLEKKEEGEKIRKENRKAENIKKLDAEEKIEPIISSPGSKARARTSAPKKKIDKSKRGKSLEAGTGQSSNNPFIAAAGTGEAVGKPTASSKKQTKQRERSRPPPTQEGGASSSVDTASLQPVKQSIEVIEKEIEEENEDRLYKLANEKNWKEDLNTDANYWNEPGVATKNMKRTIDYIRYQLKEFHDKKTNNRISKEEAVKKIINAITEKLSKQSR